jgi:hypothetical protein
MDLIRGEKKAENLVLLSLPYYKYCLSGLQISTNCADHAARLGKIKTLKQNIFCGRNVLYKKT